MSAVSYHWAAIRRALEAERRRLAAGVPQTEEPAFLPAALEVVERPVSPTARITARVLLLCLAATLVWLVLGRIDVVASAKGRVMPVGDVKLVQAANSGIVRRIWAHEGQTVRKGQPLIDLDPTVSGADEQQAEKALLAAQLEAARSQAVADGLNGLPVHFQAPANTPPEVAETQKRLALAQIAESRAETASLAAARSSALDDAHSAAAQVSAYDDTVPVLDHELDMLNGLAAKGYAPGLKILELQRERRSEASSRDVAAAQQSRGMADAAKFGQQIAQAREQARQAALSDLAKAQADVMVREEELTKARERSRIQRLVAPVDGTVQQLAVHTVGGVVEAVRPLMVVVPNTSLVVEARVLNRDVGFVKAGQTAQVKLAAFPFTRYGAIPGRIISISHDAVQTRNGSYYVARIALDRRTIDTDQGRIALSSGLDVDADIKIGSRRLISYFLNPLAAGLSKAAHER